MEKTIIMQIQKESFMRFQRRQLEIALRCLEEIKKEPGGSF